MDSKIIDWNKTPKGNDLEILGVFYAFKGILNYLLTNKDKTIEDLILTIENEKKVSEKGFKEFLNTIASINWNGTNLDKEELNIINSIKDYIKNGNSGKI